MITVSVCVGSSCHLKGSYDVIRIFQETLAESGKKDEVELSASFCLGRCAEGVTVKVGEAFVLGVNRDNAREIFEREVLAKIGK